MGKGDRKTAKGKRNISIYGNARSSVTKPATGISTAAKKAPVAKKAAVSKPAPAKAAPAKKPAAK
jgi:30S ribosomal protein S31